ncbi:hypothetical protein EJ08DRAFT_676152 [Tothia fuscella]|uniref:DUF6594 domain-containing protein n=1 Tax=Tothia fuscella TaxID=1048955 RepID=A0A9P4NXG2_9PEZI|nr:hypothetical protein EJ08DRAFT_676152 [Tothia fuscella]
MEDNKPFRPTNVIMPSIPHSVAPISIAKGPKSRLRRKKTVPRLQKPWEDYGRGFSRLAAFIANDPDKSTTIYRKFQRLSAFNLLHMESELAELEEKIDTMDNDAENRVRDILARTPNEAMMKTAEEILGLGQDWEFLQMEAYSNSEGSKEIKILANRRMKLIEKLRCRMEEYCAQLCSDEALKLAGDILNLDRPNRRTLKGLQIHLSWRRRRYWHYAVRCDEKKQNKGNLVPHKRVELAVTFISTCAAAVLLIGAILALFFVSDRKPGARLGILAGFTMFFALSLAMLTNARRQDVFAATAAYAAVLVVFVSGNLTSGTQTYGYYLLNNNSTQDNILNKKRPGFSPSYYEYVLDTPPAGQWMASRTSLGDIAAATMGPIVGILLLIALIWFLI